MDTSIGKALIMVAGVLLAILVIGFVTQTFNQTSRWATAQDQEEMAEEIEKFNKEWEVYDKDLMYGVDVISCLNKALSNDKKIINEDLDKEYEIEVKVKFENQKLKEEMILYHIVDNNNKEMNYTKTYDFNKIEGKKTLEELNFRFLKTKYPDLSSFKKSTYIKTDDGEIDLGGKEQVLNIDAINSNTNLIKLLEVTDAVSQIVKNSDFNTRNNVNGWTKIQFKTALYDLKTRKFTCTGIKYKKSGTVDTISFKEL